MSRCQDRADIPNPATSKAKQQTDVGPDVSITPPADVGLPSADVAGDGNLAGAEVALADGPLDGDFVDGTKAVPDSGTRDLAFDGPFSGPDLFTGVAPVTYTNDPNTIFANPERGFYAMYETYASSYENLPLSELQNLRTQSGVSLVMREPAPSTAASGMETRSAEATANSSRST